MESHCVIERERGRHPQRFTIAGICLPRLHWWGGGHISRQPILLISSLMVEISYVDMKSMPLCLYMECVCVRERERTYCMKFHPYKWHSFIIPSCLWPFNPYLGASFSFAIWMTFQAAPILFVVTCRNTNILWLLLVIKILFSVVKCLFSSSCQNSEINAALVPQFLGCPELWNPAVGKSWNSCHLVVGSQPFVISAKGEINRCSILISSHVDRKPNSCCFWTMQIEQSYLAFTLNQFKYLKTAILSSLIPSLLSIACSSKMMAAFRPLPTLIFSSGHILICHGP